jgi:hypothetical protein
MAHQMLGHVDLVRDDLWSTLGAERGNAAVKKELALVRRAIDEHRAKERARLQRAFSGNGGGGVIAVL